MDNSVKDEFLYGDDAGNDYVDDLSIADASSFGEDIDDGRVSLDDLVVALMMNEHLDLGDSDVFDSLDVDGSAS